MPFITNFSITKTHTSLFEAKIRLLIISDLGQNKSNKDSISINFVRKDSDGILRELLSFAYLPIEVNQYGLSLFEITDLSQISATYTTYIADGDVTGEIYSVNQELSTNFIEIQKIDSTTMDIEGRFEVLLTIYPPHGKTFPESPDTLHFTDGVFKVRVKP